MDSPRYVSVGYIRRAHGVRGWVHVESLTDNPARFETLSDVHIELGGERRLFRLERCQASSHGWLVKFEGVEERDRAEKLKGGFLQVEIESLPELDEGRYYLFELIGMSVYTISGEHLGEITDVEQYPANDVYVVQGAGGKLLLPAIVDVVKRVDKRERRMEVELPGGLEFE